MTDNEKKAWLGLFAEVQSGVMAEVGRTSSFGCKSKGAVGADEWLIDFAGLFSGVMDERVEMVEGITG